MPAEWWRDAVIYQIYVRSFADADGDGDGDLAGVRSRLGHLCALGVDAIWLTPFYPSPQADGGYDVADYCDVDPMFGTIADFDALVHDAHRAGLRVIIDIVPNHTSSAHPWFRAAVAAAPGSPARARYLFRDGRGAGGNQPPNNWHSMFGGPAWTRVVDGDGRPGQWYLHLFDAGQPDLDWMNSEVRAAFEDILSFWLDRGVDGFRVDVAHGLAKDPAMPDLAGAPTTGRGAHAGHPHWDRDEVHDVYRAWRRLLDASGPERVLVGEVTVKDFDRLARYLRPDELHTAFNFHFLDAPFEAGALRAAIDGTLAMLAGVGSPATWVLSNHDVVRHVTRYGGGERGLRRARAAALLMLALPGSTYLYQGEELGLPEVDDLPAHVRRDPSFHRTNGTTVGRDGCRVPLPWSGDQPPFGFGPGPMAWLPQPASWSRLTAARQATDNTSMLTLYRRALALRRRHPALGVGDLQWVDADDAVLAFRREPGFACVVNTGDRAVTVPAVMARGEELLASGPLSGRVIPPATAAWFGR